MDFFCASITAYASSPRFIILRTIGIVRFAKDQSETKGTTYPRSRLRSKCQISILNATIKRYLRISFNLYNLTPLFNGPAVPNVTSKGTIPLKKVVVASHPLNKVEFTISRPLSFIVGRQSRSRHRAAPTLRVYIYIWWWG